MNAASGLFVTVRERCYRVAGTTARHLAEAATLACPRRANVGHVGYTDWEIGWSFTSHQVGGRHFLAAVRVDATILRSIPQWQPPRVAEPGLVSTWTKFVTAVAKHEQGHVDIAVGGARSLHGALTATLPGASLQDLELRVAGIAASSLDAIRANDRAYDEATAHGALQGVHLPW